MLEGTDEAPRRRRFSKDFPVLFAVGMLLAFINVITLLAHRRPVELYVELEIGRVPELTEIVFNLYNPRYLILFSLTYLGILTLFWYTKSTKSIWLLACWMLLASPIAIIMVEVPFYEIMERINKGPRLTGPLEPFFYALTSLEGILSAALILCIIRACIELSVTKIWK